MVNTSDQLLVITLSLNFTGKRLLYGDFLIVRLSPRSILVIFEGGSSYLPLQLQDKCQKFKRACPKVERNMFLFKARLYNEQT